MQFRGKFHPHLDSYPRHHINQNQRLAKKRHLLVAFMTQGAWELHIISELTRSASKGSAPQHRTQFSCPPVQAARFCRRSSNMLRRFAARARSVLTEGWSITGSFL